LAFGVRLEIARTIRITAAASARHHVREGRIDLVVGAGGKNFDLPPERSLLIALLCRC
jgi:hypothetical protein